MYIDGMHGVTLNTHAVPREQGACNGVRQWTFVDVAVSAFKGNSEMDEI